MFIHQESDSFYFVCRTSILSKASLAPDGPQGSLRRLRNQLAEDGCAESQVVLAKQLLDEKCGKFTRTFSFVHKRCVLKYIDSNVVRQHHRRHYLCMFVRLIFISPVKIILKKN